MFHGSVNIVKKSSDRTTPARYRTDTRRRRNRQGHASRGETEVVEPTITITPSPVTSRTRATRLRSAPGPADPTHNPINTDGESHARLPVLLFGFSLNHRSTNAIGPRVRSARSELVVIGMRIFQPLCTQAVLNQIHWGTKYFSELSAPPLVGRHIGLKPSCAQIDVASRSTKGPRSTR